MKIGLIRETKTPPDSRVPLIPEQAAAIGELADFTLVAAPSPNRCYTNDEYRDAGIPLQEDISDCDFLLGVKEVEIDALLPEKTYFFFSHTIKKQPYNRDLLRAVLERRIRLIDYEVLTDDQGRRVIAFGRFAGMVGAHNALWTYGQRTGAFSLKRMHECYDYAEAKALYKAVKWPPVRIVVTGNGRVGNGAAEVLRDMGIRQVDPADYLQHDFSEAVFTQLACQHYAAYPDGSPFNLQEFYNEPEAFVSSFRPYHEKSDIFINGIYWDNRAPAFFTLSDMRDPAFRIRVIADVTCDIAPVSSIPATLRATTISDPLFGFDPVAETETNPHRAGIIDMMTIDNLPNELPRDASRAFGDQFLQHILPELQHPDSQMLERATIARNGQLGPHFQYLEDYVRD